MRNPIARKNVLISGVQGLLGQKLYESLMDQARWEILGVDAEENALKIPENSYIRGNFIEVFQREALLTRFRPSVIIHCEDRVYAEPPAEYLKSNFTDTFQLLSAIAEGVHEARIKPLIVLFGSCSEYGNDSPVPKSEDDDLKPVTHLGISKALQTYIAQFYIRLKRLDIIIIRPSLIYGVETPPLNKIIQIIKEIASIERMTKRPVIYLSDGNRLYNIIDIRDFTRGLMAVIEHGEPGEVYNIGNSESLSLQEIGDVLAKLAACPIQIRQMSRTDGEAADNAMDINYTCNIGKIQRLTGWHPEKKMQHIIAECLENYRNCP